MLYSRTSTSRAVRPSPPLLAETGPALGEPVLLVSAEPWLLELLSLQLRAAGCFPLAVPNIAEGRRLLAHVVPALMVLDVDGLGADDLDWAAQQVQPDSGHAVPLVLLGDAPPVLPAAPALATPDYIHAARARLCQPKPFEPRELVQSLLRMLRPAACERLAPLQCGDVELAQDQPTLRLRRGKAWVELDLPRTEHRLLSCLLAEPARVHSREDICRAVWAQNPVDLRTVDQYVRRLRRSLATAGVADLVKTVNGSGYRINPATPSS